MNFVVGKHLPVWLLAAEYLDLYHLHPTSFAHAKAHMFKLLHHILQLDDNVHLREAVTQASYVEDFRGILDQIRKKYDTCDNCNVEMEITTLPVPVYMSQPHFRKDRLAKNNSSGDDQSADELEKKKRPFHLLVEGDEQQLSKNMIRKILKKQRREAKEEPKNKCKQEKVRLELCIKCSNPRGLTCNWQLCKPCCKLKREANPGTTCDNHSRRARAKGVPLSECSSEELRVTSLDQSSS